MANLQDVLNGASDALSKDDSDDNQAPTPLVAGDGGPITPPEPAPQPAPAKAPVAVPPAPAVQKTDDTSNADKTPKRIQMPSGAVLETPGHWTDGVVNTLARELHAATQTVLGMPSAVYHAASDPETQEESQRFGKGSEKRLGPVGRVIDRLGAQPILNAIEDYKAGKISIDDVLQTLPEALGGSVGAVVAGKTASTLGAKVLGKTAPVAEAPPEVAADVSDEANAEKPKISFDSKQGEVINKHRVSLKDGATERGHVEAIEDKSEPGVWRVNTVDLDPELRGQKLGVDMYKKLIQSAKENGVSRIESGSVVSPEAQRVYTSLAKDFDVQTQKGPGGTTKYIIPVTKATPTANITTPSQLKSAVANAVKSTTTENKNISLREAQARVIKRVLADEK